MILPRAFYARPTLEVARDLIGQVLVHETRAGVAAGVIVEVEAYIGESDPACHAAPGPTRRNAPLYGPPGVAYVYLNYGMHYLVNAVTEPEGSPAAVLIRALEPIEGEALMRRRRARGRHDVRRRSRRPSLPRPGQPHARPGHHASRQPRDLTRGPLRIEIEGLPPRELAWSRRIGIRVGVEAEWRVFAAGSAAVSGRASLNARTCVGCPPSATEPTHGPAEAGRYEPEMRSSGAGSATRRSARSGLSPKASGRCAGVPA